MPNLFTRDAAYPSFFYAPPSLPARRDTRSGDPLRKEFPPIPRGWRTRYFLFFSPGFWGGRSFGLDGPGCAEGGGTAGFFPAGGGDAGLEAGGAGRAGCGVFEEAWSDIIYSSWR